jgi:hypothetical protein
LLDHPITAVYSIFPFSYFTIVAFLGSEMAFDPERPLPHTPGSWEAAMKKISGKVYNVHELKILSSASKVDEEQFLSLRVLWKTPTKISPDPQMLGIASEQNNAVEFLKSLSCWKAYLADIKNKTSEDLPAQHPFPDLGTFTLVRDSQLEASLVDGPDSFTAAFSPASKNTRAQHTKRPDPEESPTLGKGKGSADLVDQLSGLDLDPELSPESSPEMIRSSPISKQTESKLFPPTKDEQIVNTALILFLKAISIHKLRRPAWTIHRRTFKFDFASGKLEARTDGYLNLKAGGENQVKAIVEVKARVRHNMTRMQESAQMVAWIATESESEIASGKRAKRYASLCLL